MGFDMNNAWRISNINEKYKWVLGAADLQPSGIKTPILVEHITGSFSKFLIRDNLYYDDFFAVLQKCFESII